MINRSANHRHLFMSLRAHRLFWPLALGYAVFSLSGLLMWLFQMYWFLEWWGLLGIITGLMLPPLASLFPFIYWWQESFPVAYILIWLAGFMGLLIGGILSRRLIKQNIKSAFKVKTDSQRVRKTATVKDVK